MSDIEVKLIEIDKDTQHLGEFITALLERYNTVSVQKSYDCYVLKLERPVSEV